MEANDEVRIKESVSIAVRTYFSINHILSAAHFSRLSAKLEKSYTGKPSEDLHFENMAYVTGCIFAAVSSLEAMINELFTDIADHPDSHLSIVGKRTGALMATMWNLGVPRTATYPILRKYQIALILADKEVLESDKQPYQDVDLLIELRNALIHYEPETVLAYSDEGKVDIQKFEKKLKGKFSTNPLALGHAFFPSKCLGHGCAKWAVNSTIEFADEFFRRMGIPSPHDHVRARLNPG